ncbi:MAG: hypothetical protein WCK08_06265 [Betaproteobacteria bacterium]
MKLNRMSVPATVLILSALAACGGGGGGGGGSGGGSSTGASTSTLSGFAAKGTLKFATVSAYAVGADGVVAAKPAVPATETDADGLYEIKGLAPDQQYVVKVTPNSKTVHVDEIKGEQKLSDAFVLSAVAKPSAGAVTVSITPFSHQVVVAAQSAGGLNADNVAKAQAVVTELIGFDPVSIAKNDDSSVLGKQLKVLLTAVSQMASDGAIGCTSAADKTTCVTDKLASATSITSLKLQRDNLDVSLAFKTAVNQSIAEVQKTNPNVTLGDMTNVLAKLDCKASCAPVKPVDRGTAAAVAAVKAVFDEIRTDLNSMFSNDGVSAKSKGKVNAQAFKFKQVAETVQLGVLGLTQRDLQALLLGVQMYADAKGNAVNPSYSKGILFGDLDVYYGLNPNQVGGAGCTLYRDSALLVQAASAAEVNFIGCSGRFGRVATYDGAKNQTSYTEWRHGLLITPDAATRGRYNYDARALKTTWICGGGPWQNSSGQGASGFSCGAKTSEYLQKDSTGQPLTHSGVFSANVGDSLLTLSLTGALPPGFVVSPRSGSAPVSPTVSLVTDSTKGTWNLTVSADAFDAQGDPTRVGLSGEIRWLQGSNVISSIALAPGSFADSAEQSARLDITLTGNSGDSTIQAKGVLTAGSPVTDKSGTRREASRVRFEGLLSNTVTGSSRTDFLQGALDIAVSNYDKFDATKPESVSNSADVTVTFTGSVTAPDQPRLELILSATGKTNDSDNLSRMSMAYNRWVGDAKSRAINMTVERTAATANSPARSRSTLSEAGSGLSMAYTEGDANVDVLSGSSKIGVLEMSKGLATFTDGTVVSMDLGW